MDIGRRRTIRWWAGAAALGLLLAGATSAEAATSVRLADGAVLTVEEVTGAPVPREAARRPWALAFAWEEASGTRSGFVGPTVDAAIDESPLLALDPRTGDPILIWSRHDGAAMKLAWGRFEAGVLATTRFLTFGPGDDRAPALGISAAGSYLFWRGEGNSVLYAPLDLGSGRLFAPPRALATAWPGEGDRAPQDLAPLRQLAPQGGQDAPIIIGKNGGSDAPIIIGTDGGSDAPIIIGKNGGSDAPIIIGTDGGSDAPIIIKPPKPKDSPIIIGTDGGSDAPIIIKPPKPNGRSSHPSLFVFSDPSCTIQILLLGSPHGRALQAVEFAGSGRAAVLGIVATPRDMAQTDAATAAGARLLEDSCR